MDIDKTLDSGTLDGCTREGRHDYDNGSYQGKFDLWYKCRGAPDTRAVVMAAQPPDKRYNVLLEIYVVTKDDEAALEKMVAKIDRPVLRDQIGRRLHVGVRQLVALAHQRRQLADDPVDAVKIRRGALDQEVVALCANADVEQ